MWKKTLLLAIFFVLALAFILAGSFYGWPEVISAYFGHGGSYSLTMLLVFGFLAGAFSFFAPCAFVLLPGYVSYYLAQTENRDDSQNKILHSISIGLVAGLGAIIFFLFLGVGVSLVGSSLSHYLIRIKPLIALFILILGIMLLANVSMDLSKIRNLIPIPFSGRQDMDSISLRGFFLYGFGYGLATTGCTFPIFISLIIVPITSGRFLTGFLTFVSFALAMGLFMIATTVLIGFSRDALIKKMITSTKWIKRISGLILILAGLYLGYFFIRAGM